MNKAQRNRSDLLWSLQRQFPTSPATTWGKCNNDACEDNARGSGLCKTCLTNMLIEEGCSAVDLTTYKIHLKKHQENVIKLDELSTKLRGE